jgi:hypothetical protein
VGCLLSPKGTLAQGHEPPTAPADRSLEERIQELEAEKVVHEDATRSIIAQSLSQLGSRINEFVDFGGVIEVLPGWAEDFQGGDERFIELNTLELQFEIQVTDWARGSVVVEYEDGGDLVFTTTEDDEFSIDRINVDTAFLTVGDTERAEHRRPADRRGLRDEEGRDPDRTRLSHAFTHPAGRDPGSAAGEASGHRSSRRQAQPTPRIQTDAAAAHLQVHLASARSSSLHAGSLLLPGRHL